MRLIKEEFKSSKKSLISWSLRRKYLSGIRSSTHTKLSSMRTQESHPEEAETTKGTSGRSVESAGK